MSLQLFFHPFSSYSQKALIALHENATPFTPRVLSPENPATGAEFAARWPIGKFPILVDGERTIVEATAIIEYLETAHPGPVRLIPADRVPPAAAGAAIVREGRGRGAAVPAVLPAGRARPRLAATSRARAPRTRRPQ